jgi:hopanoid biosynthesis associated protein HpnK
MSHLFNHSRRAVINGDLGDGQRTTTADAVSGGAANRLILNADDFGMSQEHNEAILQAHRAGSITSASLMMGQPGIAGAVAMAHATPTLAVGLHLALSDAAPVLPPNLIPRLVRDDGKFYPNEAAVLRAAFSVEGRRQLRAEIGAQFIAFHQTGLICDHVNTHRHSHQFPHVTKMICDEARRWGVKRSRLPWDATRRPRLGHTARFIRFYYLSRILRRSGIDTIYSSIGRKWNAIDLLEVLDRLPPGLIELYFHPVTVKDHPFASDLPALLDDDVLSALARLRSSNVA